MRHSVKLADDIHPLTDFKRNTAALLKRMRKTRRPLVLTVNGKAELVVQDARCYQEMLDRLDRLEAVEAIRVGMQAAEQGRVRPASEALADLGAKLGIPR
jgi:prevent-host-death family protein